MAIGQRQSQEKERECFVSWLVASLKKLTFSACGKCFIRYLITDTLCLNLKVRFILNYKLNYYVILNYASVSQNLYNDDIRNPLIDKFVSGVEN